MGQKAIIGFRWDLRYRLRPDTLSQLLCLSLCSAIVQFIWNNYLFCLIWLISASDDRVGFITNFCSMIELLHELTSFCEIRPSKTYILCTATFTSQF